MKKVLSALLAVILVLSASQTVFGATKNDARKVIDSSVAFAFDGEYSKDGYSVNNAKNFYTLIKSGADVSAYKKGYLNSVKEALESGTLTGLLNLGLTVCNLSALGESTDSFAGFNLNEMLESADPADCSYNPYAYYYAVQAAVTAGLDETEKALCAELVKYYTPGIGTDFWSGYGTSADDLAMFILSLMPLKADYSEYISDAFTLLEGYYTDEGYTNYGANADSTALALAAYSADGNKAKADSVYNLLIANFYDAATGGFKSDYDEYYATADAVFGISVYLPLADNSAPGGNDSTSGGKQPTANSASSDKENTTASSTKQNTDKKSPQTGASYTAVFPAALALGAALLVLKKREK